jgi:hypothetical protein
MGDYLVSILEPSNMDRLPYKNSAWLTDGASQTSSHDKQNFNSSHSWSQRDEEQERKMTRQLTKMKEAVAEQESKKRSCRLLFEKHNILQGIVQSQKI